MRLLLLFPAAAALAFAQLPTPESVLGQKPGDDYFLASYDDSLSYLRRLASASDRIQLAQVGKTTQGRDWYVAPISNPSNLRDLTKYRNDPERGKSLRG